MLVETTGIVRKKMAAGGSLEEIQVEGLGEAWRSWGGGFINEARWIETIHKSTSK
jgi:hypothetical protein